MTGAGGWLMLAQALGGGGIGHFMTFHGAFWIAACTCAGAGAATSVDELAVDPCMNVCASCTFARSTSILFSFLLTFLLSLETPLMSELLELLLELLLEELLEELLLSAFLFFDCFLLFFAFFSLAKPFISLCNFFLLSL